MLEFEQNVKAKVLDKPDEPPGQQEIPGASAKGGGRAKKLAAVPA